MAIAFFFRRALDRIRVLPNFFLHRYASHRMFTMSRGWERYFYLLTFIFQGSSFLVPRAYAILRWTHHAYSDGPKDPHSPRNRPNALAMM
jgi:stearoyl-CoA desaturase (delta-9 desaturase)